MIIIIKVGKTDIINNESSEMANCDTNAIGSIIK